MELGAGFFVEKSAKDALKVLARKEKVVDANRENVLAVAEACLRSTQAINHVMQDKVTEIKAQQQRVTYKNQMEKSYTVLRRATTNFYLQCLWGLERKCQQPEKTKPKL